MFVNFPKSKETFIFAKTNEHLKMNQFVVYLEVEPYLKEWAEKHFGNPVEFPRDSVENRMIKRFLEREPKDRLPDLTGNIAVKIPMSKEKDPRAGFTYLSYNAKRAVHESLMTLFLRNLWAELGDLGKVNCQLTTLIYAWLSKHGISDENWECVRQKYYRLRKTYHEKGVYLGK